jgi:predicted HicB family RNase H-like nuclease
MARTQPNHRRALTPAIEAEIDSWSLESGAAPLYIQPRKEAASVGFNFKMTPTNHARLKRAAEAEGRSLQNLLNMIVWPAITEREEG